MGSIHDATDAAHLRTRTLDSARVRRGRRAGLAPPSHGGRTHGGRVVALESARRRRASQRPWIAVLLAVLSVLGAACVALVVALTTVR
jgi:hypothetical protein